MSQKGTKEDNDFNTSVIALEEHELRAECMDTANSLEDISWILKSWLSKTGEGWWWDQPNYISYIFLINSKQIWLIISLQDTLIWVIVFI